MKKIKIKKVLIILFLIFFIVPILVNLLTYKKFSGYLLFHKPAFRGKVIDAETKEPIEGVVVVSVYNKYFCGFGAGGGSEVVKVKETLTDENGKFFFSSYSTIILPFLKEDYTTFIKYKPGYGRLPHNRIHSLSRVSLDQKEKYFFAENFLKKGKVKVLEFGKRNSVRKVTFGVVEQMPLKTREERLRAVPGRPPGYMAKELPLLHKAINKERIGFGLKPVGRPLISIPKSIPKSIPAVNADNIFQDVALKELRLVEVNKNEGNALIRDGAGNKAEIVIGDRIGAEAGLVTEIDSASITIRIGNTLTKIPVFYGLIEPRQ